MIRNAAWLCPLMCVAMQSGAQQQAGRAWDFVESVGVNTHFSYTDTTYYQRTDEIVGAIRALGVHHVRDGFAYGWVPPKLYGIYAQLHQAGIHPLLVMPNPGPRSPAASAIVQLLSHYPGVDALEAPNEYDQAKKPNWTADLKAYLPTLMQAAANAGVVLIGPSLTQPASYGKLGSVAPLITMNNLHAYWGGRNPETGGWGGPDEKGHRYGSFEFDLDYLSVIGPGKPAMMTETGYVVNNTPRQNVISESVEAIYEPRLLLHAWNMGIKRTYIYELTEDPSSPAGIGLLRGDLSPRPAFTALSNLMKLLADSPGDFAPGVLRYSIGGNAEGIERTLLQKRDGSFWLALWNRACVYEVNELRPLPVPVREVTLTVAGGKRVRRVWTFADTGAVAKADFDRSAVTLQVGSTVTMVNIE